MPLFKPVLHDEGDLADLVSLSGVAANSTDLGAFDGELIADGETVKGALQDLEGAIEATNTTLGVAPSSSQQAIGADAAILAGVSLGEANMGAFTGSTIGDGESIKGALQDLETAVELKADDAAINGRVDAADAAAADLATLSGVAAGETDLGAFGGSTLSPNLTVKAALGELEVAVEDAANGAAINARVDLTDADVAEVRAAIGLADGETNVGTFTGTTITSFGTAKELSRNWKLHTRHTLLLLLLTSP